jgi:hypothetical protein
VVMALRDAFTEFAKQTAPDLLRVKVLAIINAVTKQEYTVSADDPINQRRCTC